jgi:hypothetical protein
MSEFDLPLSIVLGVGLAAATGLRVFLPKLVVSGADYAGHLPLAENFAWLGTASALTMLSVAALAEILAYSFRASTIWLTPWQPQPPWLPGRLSQPLS